LFKVFCFKYPKHSIPQQLFDTWFSKTKEQLLGKAPMRRKRGAGQDPSSESVAYQRRSKQIYGIFERAQKTHNCLYGQHTRIGKKAKAGGGGGSDDVEDVSESPPSEGEDENENSVRPAAKEFCGSGEDETWTQRETELNIEGPILFGDSFGGLGGGCLGSLDGGALSPKPQSIRGVVTSAETGKEDSGDEEEVREGEGEGEDSSTSHEDIEEEEEEAKGGRPRRVIIQIDRLAYPRSDDKKAKPHSKSVRRAGSLLTPHPTQEQGFCDLESLPWTHLKNVGVYIDLVSNEASPRIEELAEFKDHVMKTFGVSNTKVSASQSFRQPQSEQHAKFSSCPASTLHGLPKGAVCRVIRNMNGDVLHVEVFPESIHIFDTLCVIGRHLLDMETTTDAVEFVSGATENLTPVLARRYNLRHGDIIFVDARMLVRVTENARTSTPTKIVFEECVVSLFSNHLSVDNLKFNYPDKCLATEYFFKRHVVVEKAVLQHLFPTLNMASGVLSLMSSKYLNSICKEMDKTVSTMTTLQRLQHLDVVANFVEAEALRRNCLKSLGLERNADFKKLSVWDIRIFVLASLYAKSTFFAEVLKFNRLTKELQDAVKHLCRSAAQTSTFTVGTVKISDLQTFVSTSASGSVEDFLRNFQMQLGDEGYVQLKENDKSRLSEELVQKLGESCQTQCSCLLRCGEQCRNRLAYILCSGECCALVKASPQGQCGNAIADLPIPDVVVRNCNDYSLGKELTAGQEGFRKGDYLGQYIGELVTSNVPLGGGLRYTIRCDMKSSSIPWPSFVYINAETKGNISRRANHSHNPNCDVMIWFENDYPIALMSARREILPGEGITFDYQWKGQDCFGAHGCLCQSEFCPNKGRRNRTSVVENLLMTSRKNAWSSFLCHLSTVSVAKKTTRCARRTSSESSLTGKGNNQRYLFIDHED